MIHHPDAHPLAGQLVRLGTRAADPTRKLVVPGAEFHLEDWWDRVSGGSWMYATGNPAALAYAIRAADARLPLDNQVVYGKIAGLGHLVHISELDICSPLPPDMDGQVGKRRVITLTAVEIVPPHPTGQEAAL